MACLGLLAGAAVIFGPSLRPTPSQIDAARLQLARETGLSIEFRTPPVILLLPHPEVIVDDVVVSADGGAVDLQVPKARASLSIPALLRGRTVIQSLYLDALTGTIDGDRVRVQPAVATVDAFGPTPPVSSMMPAKLTITGGFVQMRSSEPALTGFFSEMHLVLDGLRSGAASLSGGASWHGERVDVSGRLDSLAGFARGEPAAGSLRLTSRVVTASLAGAWPAGWRSGFRGSVSVSSPTLSGLMRMVGVSPGVLAGIERFGFSGTTDSGPTGLAFADARVSVNADTFEGTLGIEDQTGRRNVVATLAADDFDLGPFVTALSSMRVGDSGQGDSLALFGTLLRDADVRLSVGRAKLNGFHLDDVALSLLSRDERFELSLADARAYGGSVKARLFANGAGNGLSLKGDAAWSQVNVESLAAAAELEGTPWRGTTSGSVVAESSGDSVGSVLANVSGRAQAGWQQGSLPAAPALAALLKPQPSSDAGEVRTTTEFDLAEVEASAAGGIVRIEKGAITGSDAGVSLQGRCNLVDGSYSVVAQDTTAGAVTDEAPLRGAEGVWGSRPHRFSPSRPPRWPARLEVPAGGLIP